MSGGVFSSAATTTTITTTSAARTSGSRERRKQERKGGSFYLELVVVVKSLCDRGDVNNEVGEGALFGGCCLSRHVRAAEGQPHHL